MAQVELVAADAAREELLLGLARDFHAEDGHPFLRLSFTDLERRFGSVVGVRAPRPRLIPVALLR